MSREKTREFWHKITRSRQNLPNIKDLTKIYFIMCTKFIVFHLDIENDFVHMGSFVRFAAIDWHIAFFSSSLVLGLVVLSGSPEENISSVNITALRDQVSWKEFSRNLHQSFRCVTGCLILLEPHIRISKFGEFLFQKVSQHIHIPFSIYCNLFLKKVRASNNKICSSAPNSYTLAGQFSMFLDNHYFARIYFFLIDSSIRQFQSRSIFTGRGAKCTISQLKHFLAS